MSEALYHPGLGYYANGKCVIGGKGDFITNVSVGPLFGILLARQFAQMWVHLGQPARFDIVEQGAHNGDFSSDLFGALQKNAAPCFEAARLTIIEPIPTQQSIQAAKLAGYGSKVSWADDLGALAPINGVYFSNELLDAFPIHRVTWTGREWLEQHVDLVDAAFTFCDRPISSTALREQLAMLPSNLPAGYTTEVNLAALQWSDTIADKLDRGFVLLIDYGYPRAEFYRPERMNGTLSAYSQQRRVNDPLVAPGEIDLTAHVDFTSVAERAERGGLKLHGFTDQHHFMVGVSRLHFKDDDGEGSAQAGELRAFKTLMHPSLMGASFKALCLERGIATNIPLAGFSFCRDSRAALGLD